MNYNEIPELPALPPNTSVNVHFRGVPETVLRMFGDEHAWATLTVDDVIAFHLYTPQECDKLEQAFAEAASRLRAMRIANRQDDPGGTSPPTPYPDVPDPEAESS